MSEVETRADQPRNSKPVRWGKLGTFKKPLASCRGRVRRGGGSRGNAGVVSRTSYATMPGLAGQERDLVTYPEHGGWRASAVRPAHGRLWTAV